MKSQDIGLLLKLESMRRRELNPDRKQLMAWPHDWQDWSQRDQDVRKDQPWDNAGHHTVSPSSYSARALQEQTGISKSQIALSIRRSIDCGLAKYDRKTGAPRANVTVLFEFIVHGLKYVFPAKPGTLTRGIATAYSAPVLQMKLISAGDLELVWPNAQGHTMGLTIEPLFSSVDIAIRHDPELYATLALLDAIRVGQPRESQVAQAKLREILL